MGYNPCYCWNLKDGCITIGIWSLVWSCLQMGIYGWQSWIIRWKLDLVTNRMGRIFTPQNMFYSEYGRTDWTQYYISPQEKFFMSIFIIQIINIIGALFLLFASGSLIYGIHTNSKHLVWPWFPCMTITIIGSAVYCILWWAGDVESYWLVLTIVEFLSIIVNVYCLLCVIVQYNRILNGYVQQEDDDKPRKIVYEYVPKHPPQDSKQPPIYSKNLIEYDEKPPKYQPHEMLPVFNDLQRMYASAAKRPMTQQQIGSPEFKARFTEAWINGVKPDNRDTVAEDHHQAKHLYSTKSSRGKQEAKELTKSMDRLDGESKMRASVRSCKSKESISSRSHRHHCRHHCSSRRHKRNASMDESLSDTNDDNESTTRHARSCSTRCSTRSLGAYSVGRESCASTSAPPSDSDTGILDGDRSKRRRHRCRHRTADDAAAVASSHRQHRRPRDVKRDDRRRRVAGGGAASTSYDVNDITTDQSSDTSATYDRRGPQQVQQPRMAVNELARQTKRPPAGSIPVLPYPGQPGTISIPQNIVIPARLPNRGLGSGPNPDPQKYHINSEITIHYDGAEKSRAKTTPQSGLSSTPQHDRSGSSGLEQKKYVSTAV